LATLSTLQRCVPQLFTMMQPGSRCDRMVDLQALREGLAGRTARACAC
jgi:hypothetical protein